MKVVHTKKTIIGLMALALFSSGCSMKAISKFFQTKSITVDRIKAPDYNLGHNKKLALVNVDGPWQARNMLSATMTEKTLKQQYFRFMNLNKTQHQGEKHEVRIIIDTQNGSAKQESQNTTEKKPLS